jgi:hypothetical protein
MNLTQRHRGTENSAVLRASVSLCEPCFYWTVMAPFMPMAACVSHWML